MTNYIFDIDGTLTPSRLPIDKDFKKWFLNWCKNKDVYFVTGSNKDKTIEQIGIDMWLAARRVYQACGNVVYQKGQLVRSDDFEPSHKLHGFLCELLEQSPWYGDYGNNIEKRIGLVNFSNIGRDCPQEKREEYFANEKERVSYAKAIMDKFPHLEACVGGQISIDIYMRGKNKAQILNDISGYSVFFGDGCEDGNDAPLAERVDKAYQVSGWQETWDILKSLEEK